jgi:excisionase family DNA binding protein
MSDITINAVAAPIDRAAELVGMSRRSIENAVHAGELPIHYPTRRGLILIEDLRAWVASAPTANPRRTRRT